MKYYLICVVEVRVEGWFFGLVEGIIREHFLKHGNVIIFFFHDGFILVDKGLFLGLMFLDDCLYLRIILQFDILQLLHIMLSQLC